MEFHGSLPRRLFCDKQYQAAKWLLIFFKAIVFHVKARKLSKMKQLSSSTIAFGYLHLLLTSVANDCNIVTLLTVYNSVTVVQIEGMNYGSD